MTPLTRHQKKLLDYKKTRDPKSHDTVALRLWRAHAFLQRVGTGKGVDAVAMLCCCFTAADVYNGG